MAFLVTLHKFVFDNLNDDLHIEKEYGYLVWIYLIKWVCLLVYLFHRVSIERKCPYMKKLEGQGNFPLYFDNDDVTYI